MQDGNVAFKVTWVYGPEGPFSGPCTAEGREINILRERKVWCSDADSKCAQIFRAGNTGKVPCDHQPCYEAGMFQDWTFGAGVYHHGERRGIPIKMKYVRPGKLAFFTSKRHGVVEEYRVVIGCFNVKGVDPEAGADDDSLVTSVPESRIRLRDLDNAPRYWDFHTQHGPPRWNTGLFRYLPDYEAVRLGDAMKAALEKERAKKR